MMHEQVKGQERGCICVENRRMSEVCKKVWHAVLQGMGDL